MEALSRISLDLLRPGYETVYAAPLDCDSRGVIITLLAGSQAWTPPSGASAAIEVRKPDGSFCVYDTLEDGETAAYTINGNTITIRWAQQALTAPGTAVAAVRFYNASGKKLSTFPFRLVVPVGAVSDAYIESTDYFSLFSMQIAALLGATTHPPQIDPITNHWLFWDEHQGVYVDSGYSSVGKQGPPEIPTATVSYQAGTSPTAVPTGTWLSSPPSVAAGAYLWTRVQLHYSSGTDTTYYSVAYQGQNGAGTQITTYTSLSVPVSAWTSGGITDYPYQADVTCNGVSVSDYAFVTLAASDAASGRYASVCETLTDAVRIYAVSVPDAVLTIPTIAVWR